MGQPRGHQFTPAHDQKQTICPVCVEEIDKIDWPVLIDQEDDSRIRFQMIQNRADQVKII